MDVDANDRPWVPLSTRYGLMRHGTSDHISCRHGRVEGDAREDDCEDDPRLTCACPGRPSSCCARATQEDRLCDACREHCWAVDDAKVYHRLIDVYGPSDGRVAS